MQIHQVRLVAEAVGITALVVSLVLISFELKQTRDMNLAQLYESRIALPHARFTAMLESESMLSVYSKQFLSDWEAPHLTELERAAAEINAWLMLSEFHIQYTFIQHGFATDDLDALKRTIRFNIKRLPEAEKVWQHWWIPGDTNFPFGELMNDIFIDK